MLYFWAKSTLINAMKDFFHILLFLFLAGSQSIFGQYTESINSNIPGMSMSPFAVGKTLIQVETNGYYMTERNVSTTNPDKGKGYGGNIALRYGVWREEFEAVLTAEYRAMNYVTFPVNSHNGIRNITVGAKYLFYDPFKNYEEKVNVYSWKANQKFKWKRLKPAIAAYLGANVNVLDNKFAPVYPTIGPKLMVLFHNNLGKGTILTTNLFANNFIDPSINYGVIITASKALGKKFSVFVENESYLGNYTNFVFTLGGTFLATDDIQVHTAISNSPPIGNTLSQTYGGVGFSWRFDRMHKPVELYGKGEKNHNKDQKAGDKKVRNPPIKFD